LFLGLLKIRTRNHYFNYVIYSIFIHKQKRGKQLYYPDRTKMLELFGAIKIMFTKVIIKIFEKHYYFKLCKLELIFSVYIVVIIKL